MFSPLAKLALAALPTCLVLAVIEFSKPVSSAWLSPSSPHFLADVLRQAAFLYGGFVIGLSIYVVIQAIVTEDTVTLGHPRRRLFEHIIVISTGHAMLVTAVLFYIRENIGQAVSAGVWVALASLVLSSVALLRTLGYEQSRLHAFHTSRPLLALLIREQDDCLLVKPIGSVEKFALDEWFASFRPGELVSLIVEETQPPTPEDAERFLEMLARRMF